MKTWRIVGLAILLVIAGIFIYITSDKNRHTDIIEDSDTPIVVLPSESEFSDGLKNPTRVRHFRPDDTGAGVTEIAEYTYDINHDGRPDRITRSRHDNGTAHFQFVYKIELNNGQEFIDVTPRDFYTVEGADCALQKLKFSFEPDFSVIKISRPMGDDWNTPTQSTKTVFSLWGNKMHIATSIEYKTVCDVSEL